MASLFRRRRSLFIKAVVVIPIIWLLVILIFSYDSGSGDSGLHEEHHVVKKSHWDPPVQQRANVNRDSDSGSRREEHWSQNRAQEEDSIRRQAEERRRRDEEDSRRSEEERKKMEEALKFKPEKSQEIKMDPNAPGEKGRGVKIDKDKLTAEERRKYDEGWQKNAYNQYVSDMISVHRSLPDVRDAECQDVRYKQQLPDTSVVVCFHNEAWSVLLRTIHSILDRSPSHLLREIVLVDDFSDMDHLKGPLEEYVQRLGKVKVIRTKQREGLIRARLIGFSSATAQVVTFLDSHCECSEGWLEPLLDRIAENETNVVCPVIDIIEDDTLHYQYGSAKSTSIGGFDWNLQFTWHTIPDHERKRRGSDIAPVRSPTMAGGLFAISRRYFEHIGTYDPGMDIWGGENLELSFRVWMCGGVLEIIPCSHVGHIFRKRSPYKWRTGVNVVKKNSIRLAEVWMDDFKQYYYERFNYDLGDFGDVRERKQLRERLQCHDFAWFIHNIYPDLFIPAEALASGEIRSKARPMCIDSPTDQISFHKVVAMWACHGQGGNQYWMLSKGGEIRRDEGCLDYSSGADIIVYPCHGQKGNQEWVYREDNTLFHKNTKKCAEITLDGKKLTMASCTGIDRQLWQWERRPANGVLRS